jgi:hypothetical protein
MKARTLAAMAMLALPSVVFAAGSGSGSPDAGATVNTSPAGRSGGPLGSQAAAQPGGGTGGAGDGMRSPGQGSKGGMQPVLPSGGNRASPTQPGAPLNSSGGTQSQ